MRLDGKALPRRARPSDFFRRVQMVFQDPYGSLHPRQTVDRALAEPLLVHGIGDVETRIAARPERSGAAAPTCASAIRTSSPAASASASRSRAR